MNFTNFTGTPNLPDEYQPELGQGLSLGKVAISSGILSAVLLVLLACIRLVQITIQEEKPAAARNGTRTQED